MGGNLRINYRQIAEKITDGNTELEIIDFFCNNKRCHPYINTENRKLVNSFFNVISTLIELEPTHPGVSKDPKWASHFIMLKHRKMKSLQIQLIVQSLNNAGWTPQPAFAI